jgi:hypothetical protein
VKIAFAMGKELGARREGLDEIHMVAQELGPPFNSLSKLRLYDLAFYCYEVRQEAGVAEDIGTKGRCGDEVLNKRRHTPTSTLSRVKRTTKSSTPG